MIKLPCSFRGGHTWKSLIICATSFGDERMEGEICTRCNKMIHLVERPLDLSIFDNIYGTSSQEKSDDDDETYSYA
jgi:hypothetical protein